MMGYTLLLTERFKNSQIIIKTLVDNDQNKLYNVIYIDNTWVLNYKDFEPVSIKNIPESLRLENQVELARPR